MLLTLWIASLTATPGFAWQPKRVVRPDGVVVPVGGNVPPGVVPQGVPGQPNPNVPPGTVNPNQPVDPNKPKEGEKKKGQSPLTTRPAKPPTPPNPDELKNLKPDEEGKVKFNLKGQPWPDVLDWLGETSQKSLDWQELPNDDLNLVTQRSYSIDEARDLLNGLLLSRWFTMLTRGETISVVNVSKINPGMVPRIEPDELASLPDHDFVKTSFPLVWLLADQAETELKPMLSPNGKLTHLTNTNRLEAMDSVKNVREVWAVIQEEQSGGKQEQLVREFKLKHTNALDQLEDLLQKAAPPKRDYKVFYLKHSTTWAYSVELSLKDFFAEDKKKSSSSFNPYSGRMESNSNQDSARRLSKKKPLQFIYDKPLATDGNQVRKTQVFTLKYSKATVLAEAVKDVYRDLLSTNDKAYQNNQPGKEGQKPPERNYTFVYGNSESDDKSKQETPIKFKGLVSLGVDDISNTIIVSAPESLLENISELIDQLDRAARPTNSVQVVKFGGKINSTELQKRLSKIFTKPQPKPPPQRPQQPQQPHQQPQEQPEEQIFLP